MNISCTSMTANRGAGVAVSFATAKAILRDFKSQDQLKNLLGKPSERLIEGAKEFWNYDEPDIGYQRLTLEFDQAKKLESVLWIPRSHEPECKLAGVLVHYPSSKFRAIETRETAPPHVLDTETVYSDEKSMSILQDDSSKSIQAISWYIDEQPKVADPKAK